MAFVDPAAYEAELREKARRSLHFFTRRMFKARRGYRWIDNWHHRELCRALMRVFKGEVTRLIVNMPPRYSKTEIAVVNFMAWALGHFPDAEFIHTSYSSTLAEANAFAAKLLVESAEYAAIFPEVGIRHDSNAKGYWRTTAGGVVYAQGSGGTITGFGAGKMRAGFGGAIIIDDPHKADEARSDVRRKAVIDWFGNTLESRKNDPARTPIILIMQRLHESDLAGFLLAGGNGERWEVVTFPAIREPGCYWPEDAPDALWPAKHSLEELRRMEAANPYVFAGQYQQRPSPLKGGEFKPDNIQIIEAAPVGTRWVRAWDFAGTEADGDWTAGAKLGVAPSGRLVIGDMQRGQLAPEDVEKLLKTTAELDGKGITVAFPQDPGQAGKAQSRNLTRLLAGWPTSSKPVSGDKITRARPLAARVNLGDVDMVRGDWNKALLDELRFFPNGANDDQIDALALAYDELTAGETSLLDFYRQQAEEVDRLKKAAQEAAQAGPQAFMLAA